MPPQVKRWGSITILSGLGGSLVAAIIIWLFSSTLQIAPQQVVLTSLENAVVSLTNSIDANTNAHHSMTTRINLVEYKCNKNEKDINACRAKIHEGE